MLQDSEASAGTEAAIPPLRRVGTETSKTRAILMDTAETLMCEEGYAAVTSRKLAARAGLKPQLVHYYFRTMDDLFLAVFNRIAEQYLERQRVILETSQSISLVWELSKDHTQSMLNAEFMALSNHRKAIKTAIAEFGEAYRRNQTLIITNVLKDKGIDFEAWPPVAIAALIECTSRFLVLEDMLGMSSGHAEVVMIVNRFIAMFDGAKG